METNSINAIKLQRDKINIELVKYIIFMKTENIDLKLHQLGPENEYSINDIIGGIKNIITDINYLLKAHDYFIKCSTYSERSQIGNQLTNLSAHISNRNHSNIATDIDNLKISLRLFILKNDKNHYLEFIDEIDNVRKKAMFLEDEITQTKSKLSESEILFDGINEQKSKIDDEFKKIETTKSDLIKEIDAFIVKHQSFEELADKAITNEDVIAKKLEDILESEKKFNVFINQIDGRNKELSLQKIETENYKNSLLKYNSEHERILKEAQNLIEKSLQALQYTTSEGISTAFLSQYRIANKPINRISWLIGASVFIILTLSLGIWILTGWGIKNLDPVISIIGRLSLIPFTLLGSLFCANQYIKQKNLIEDYAYKSVLAKSMVAFSEELRIKDPERYAEYLSTVLKEIHQDPLRKRVKEKDDVSLKDTVGLIDKLGELIKIATKS